MSNAAQHVAIIMDGNGRWAQQRGRPRLVGHHAGAKRIREIVEACPAVGVKYLTVFAFSTENWKRSESEVAGLMSLFKQYIKSESKKLLSNGVKVLFIGDRSRLDSKLITLMNELEVLTKNNVLLTLTIALNYGGRDEIIRATKLIASKVKLGELIEDEITPEVFSFYLDTSILPDPDLIIRTSGEYRTSNFLPWQSVYSEYAFVKVTWPDFDTLMYKNILEEFKARDRRFGLVK